MVKLPCPTAVAICVSQTRAQSECICSQNLLFGKHVPGVSETSACAISKSLYLPGCSFRAWLFEESEVQAGEATRGHTAGRCHLTLFPAFLRNNNFFFGAVVAK
jgi:hypothetical protein